MPKQLKRTYRVKDGCNFGAVNQYPAGSEVQLFEHEAAGFMDKLILLDDTSPKGRKKKSQPKGDLKNDLEMEVESGDEATIDLTKE